MRSFSSINQLSNKLKRGCPQEFFFRGAKATSPFLIPSFPFLSFFFPPSLFALASPPRRAAHLNLARGFGEGCKLPQQEPQHKTTCSTCLQIRQFFFLGGGPLTPHSNYCSSEVNFTKNYTLLYLFCHPL